MIMSTLFFQSGTKHKAPIGGCRSTPPFFAPKKDQKTVKEKSGKANPDAPGYPAAPTCPAVKNRVVFFCKERKKISTLPPAGGFLTAGHFCRAITLPPTGS